MIAELFQLCNANSSTLFGSVAPTSVGARYRHILGSESLLFQQFENGDLSGLTPVCFYDRPCRTAKVPLTAGGRRTARWTVSYHLSVVGPSSS